MKTILDCKPGEFYGLSGSYLLVTQSVPAGTVLTIGPKLPLTCMFEINFVLLAGERVGFLFTSRFEVENGGAYLLTSMKGKRVASQSETLVKDENLVLYSYPNVGALAISPVVNSEIETIFQDQ